MVGHIKQTPAPQTVAARTPVTASRPVIALVDSLLSAGGQWSTVIVLLMYLGVAPAEVPKPSTTQLRKPRRRDRHKPHLVTNRQETRLLAAGPKHR